MLLYVVIDVVFFKLVLLINILFRLQDTTITLSTYDVTPLNKPTIRLEALLKFYLN